MDPAVTALLGVIVGGVLTYKSQAKLEDRRQKAAERKELRGALNHAAGLVDDARAAVHELRDPWKRELRWDEPEVQEIKRRRKAARDAARHELRSLAILVGPDHPVYSTYADVLQAVERYWTAFDPWKLDQAPLSGDVLREVKQKHTDALDAEDAFLSAAYKAAGLSEVEATAVEREALEPEADDGT